MHRWSGRWQGASGRRSGDWGLGARNTSLIVYDLLGWEVAVLVNGRRKAECYTVEWDGSDEHGRQVSSGVYLYRLTAGSFIQWRKMLLLR